MRRGGGFALRWSTALMTGAVLSCSPMRGCDAGGATTVANLELAGEKVRVELDPNAFRHGLEPLYAWVQRSGEIVARYYGHFPTHALRLQITAVKGTGVRGGQTFGSDGGLIRVRVGSEVSPEQLQTDWVLVHEMTHLALPDVGERHAWLSEGVATYVEGVARVQAGDRTETDVWAEELRSMPHGLPEPGDRGLDHTHTWGRTYWGGAMFCLLADVDIHRRTGNRLGLQDALRAILNASGGLVSDWPIERVMKSGDAALGVPVLEELYLQMKDAPAKPDLVTLWHQLGVDAEGGAVRLNDAAPLAPIRKSIMRSGS